MLKMDEKLHLSWSCLNARDGRWRGKMVIYYERDEHLKVADLKTHKSRIFAKKY